MPALTIAYDAQFFATCIIERNTSRYECFADLFSSEAEIVALYNEQAHIGQITSTRFLAQIAALISNSSLPEYI